MNSWTAPTASASGTIRPLSAAPTSPRPWLLPAVEIVTIGLPFCAFKVLTGLVLLEHGAAPAGYALIALGAIDLALNLVNLGTLLGLRRAVSGVCLSDVVMRRLGRSGARPDLGLALDALLSFGLVAIVIGFGLLRHLPRWGLVTWNVAVILNVIGAGLSRLWAALRARAAP